LRIESPGENFEVERALLSLGVSDAGGLRKSPLSAAEIAELQFENGRILSSSQWYRGWRIALDRVRGILERFPGCRAMNSAHDIGVMFDKARCHEIFAARHVPATELLGVPDSFAHLRQIMEARRCRRIFLKPCHSSSASGVVAFEIGGASQQAFSSVEIVREKGRVKLFNSLSVRRYHSAGEIAELIDAICREQCIAEAWFPKAGLEDLTFDLRVLVIAGAAQHAVVRQSASPITNLHLGNRRGSIEKLKQRMGPENWGAALSVCERAAGAFPDSLYVAVDLLVAPGFRRFAVAEVNAFGDLLPNLEYRGMDTYAAELAALGMAPNASATAANQVSTMGL
jgi:glutathione synthase/RimK-type ligase-like ATP-grasp enzyme